MRILTLSTAKNATDVFQKIIFNFIGLYAENVLFFLLLVAIFE